jgi:hypothetical protein
MDKKMSDTPRTDAIERDYGFGTIPWENNIADLARQLERELAEFKEMYAKEAHAKMVLLEQLAEARKDVIEECIALVQTWFDAYPTNHNNDAMGRHMAGQIMKQMRELSFGQVLDNGQKESTFERKAK